MRKKKPTASTPTLRPDPRYRSLLVSKFINCLMIRGKKSVAQRIFYQAMDTLEERAKNIPPQKLFETAVNNVKPLVEVRSRRVGGATYQVPREVPTKRRQSLAIRWIIEAAQKKKGRPMYLRLADEFMAAYKKEGDAMTTRENIHRMAEANKAFAHFSW
ncbi:MAG: 30S ribosomal protein S7 [Planctomycetes bacterium DG_23]|nr:MAG: 30S ribosomal protein S7 [Planctomycetes bacterium DG_23]